MYSTSIRMRFSGADIRDLRKMRLELQEISPNNIEVDIITGDNVRGDADTLKIRITARAAEETDKITKTVNDKLKELNRTFLVVR